jgi:hypothetical protein
MREDYILQLDVPVDDIVLMQVIDSLNDLPDDDGGSFLGEGVICL